MYHLTVYDQEGNKLVDEPIEAKSDDESKKKGHTILSEKEYQGYPFRIVHSAGRLVEFQSHQPKKATP
jgi:hypothetical protein